MSSETTPANTAILRKADAAMYQRVFVGHAEGALVLEDLLARFHDRKMWAPGGLEGQRETERRAAQAEVLRFVLGQCGQLPETKGEGNEE